MNLQAKSMCEALLILGWVDAELPLQSALHSQLKSTLDLTAGSKILGFEQGLRASESDRLTIPSARSQKTPSWVQTFISQHFPAADGSHPPVD